MKHYYSDAQSAATNIIYKSYLEDSSIESVEILGSVYMPLMVFIRIRQVQVDSNGGGGYATEYIAIDFEGSVIRQAYKNLEFDSDKARILIFSELTPINRP